MVQYVIMALRAAIATATATPSELYCCVMLHYACEPFS